MTSSPNNDPMEFLKSLWSSMNLPLPGLMTPTLDGDELDKRIRDLSAVAGWLQSNLSMLQMTIQGLEMQRSALKAMQAIGGGNPQTAGNQAPNTANPFTNPALWPWNFNQAGAGNATPAAPADAKPDNSTK